MSANPIQTIRQGVDEYMRMLGEPIPLKGVILLPADDGIEPIPVRFLSAPKLTSIEAVIVDAIRQAGEPLMQKEIAPVAGLSVRTVQKATAQLRDRGVLLHHPTLGFYLPGMDVGDEKLPS